MASAKQQLDEINKRARSGGRSGNDTSLPANYSEIIKAAQAEQATARRPQSVATPKASAGANVGATSTRSSGQPRNVPAPSSASDARSARGPSNVPTPTARDSAVPVTADDSGGEGGILAVLGTVLGAGAAYALYKRLAKGDPSAIEEAKSVLSEGAAADSKSTAVAAASEQGVDPARFGEDPNAIVDAEYEELPQQKQLASPDPRAGMEDYIDMLDADGSMNDDSFVPQQRMIAGPEAEAEAPIDEDAAAQEAIERGNGPRTSNEDIDTIIRQALEEGSVADRGGRVRPRIPTNNASPNIKPRIKPKA